MNHFGHHQDAESCGKIAIELILQRKPKVWRGVFATLDEELNYVAWISRWAFHWAAKA